MRVIAGKYKSRLIASPKGVELRPTSDRVKESLFGILGASVIDRAVLDLFSGTGNLGIEALSRGAKSCVFVDTNPRCISAIKGNLKTLCINDNIEVILKDGFRYIKDAGDKGLIFGLIFLDPPYYKDLIKKSLILLDNYNIINTSTIIVAEHYRRDDLPDPLDLKHLKLIRQEKYGSTLLSFYTIG